ncbi:FG-GAP repeat domain-containing protein [Streptomyces sp. NPDC057052]|uniref:FG-GAP repeat domain-containing protein n=1 Tax=Streptomyces sp. NPDC057052 TaxID=3346010 RepID=UPI00362556FD
MARRARITLTFASLVALGAGSLTTAGPAAADTTPLPLTTSGVWGIDFAGGVLTTVERAPNGDPYVTNRPVSADGSTVGARELRAYAGEYATGAHVTRTPCDAGTCVPLRAAGNGNVGVFFGNSEEYGGQERAQIWTARDSYHSGSEPLVTGGRYVDTTGRYFVYEAASTGRQYVDSVQPYHVQHVRLTRAVTAASVWGSRLYAPGTGDGTVTAYDLEQKKTVETLATGAPCTVGELQVVGRWVYWNCGPTGAAGVFDRTAKKNVTVPSGPALVGDGYLVRHDRATGKLMLTDFHTGTAAAAREIADLPAGNTADQRRQTWSVDKFGGDIAYVDPDSTVHVVRSGVPSQPLAPVEAEVDDASVNVADDWWNSTWQLSKPATWTFTVKDAQGHHDQGGYSYGELVTLNASGALSLHYTHGKGTFDWKVSTGGWPAGTVAVPFGDLTGDRCAEMLVRMPGGELRRYTGKCGVSYSPSSSRLSLGTGWNTFDVLTAPGDVSGDGRPDLIARKAATGAVYLYKGTSAGRLAAPVKLYDNWKTYKKVVGAGDLNGDGVGDLLAQDKANNLYRYYGTGRGTFSGRVKLYAAWGASYNALVGVGDVTGDGKADLVARDTAGVLWRMPGTGKGTFSARVRTATGWQGYKGLF